ncbi:MAG: hypothetical protein EA379_08205 [Phycisphaerales bacterium]|nr:MAG: hypothetical protein EA379_08205 [Phycisphaerales bacterium]
MRSLLQDPVATPGAESGVDLRRRRTRRLSETVLARAEHLDAEEASLIRAVYGQGLSVVEVARLRGEPARALRRRVRRIVARLLTGRFAYVARRRSSFTPTRRRVAEACVLRGMSLREASASLGISFHCVRRHMEAVNALSEQEGA